MSEQSLPKATELEWHVAQSPDDITATGISIKDSADRMICDFDECFEFSKEETTEIALLLAQAPAMRKLLEEIARSGKLTLALYAKFKALMKKTKGGK